MAISPSNDFKVYRACPEIRSHIRRVYGWFILRCIVAVPFVVVMLTMQAICFVLDFMSRCVDFLGEAAAELGDWATTPMIAKESLTIMEAHKILPLSEIQTRTPNLYLPRGRVTDPTGDDILNGDDHV